MLSYVTIITHDVDALGDFYAALLDLQEVTASRSGRYREFLTGGSKLGFAYKDAYATLGARERAFDDPVNTVLSFDVGDRAKVDALTSIAIERGARVVKRAWTTDFGQYQTVFLDQEGNLFRLTAAA